MSDQLVRFLLPQAHVRGAFVRLDATWQQSLTHARYPEHIETLLGEALAATALLGAHAKVEGRLSLQASSRSGLRTLFAECTAQGTLRGIARLSDDAPLPHDLSDLGEGAVLAVTIENPSRDGREPMRYQGLVPLQSPTLAGALESYFAQSEQLPTRLFLAADAQHAAGLLVQIIPGSDEGDDGWTRAQLLADTLSRAELLQLAPDELLHRLFHQECVEILARRPLQFGCSCSRERVEDVLRTLGRQEADAAAATGKAEVICEFCARRYVFTPEQIGQLFGFDSQNHHPPSRIQ